ncbi:MAG TPA: hypothetical protein VGS20_09990 [Candidatus Acidoferrales bacterium]|nr:hypothetical protein [Candidatus Acidoferrales bacterium]
MSLPVRYRASAALTGLLLMAACVPAGARSQAAQSKPAGAPTSPNLGADEAVRGKKLILKDGTFQVVREYRIEGDRVRYYSIERSQWEEIPSALVDWDATRKAETEPSASAKKAQALAHRVDLESRPGSLDVGGGLGLPAGVLIPPGDGIYAFDGHAILKLDRSLSKSKLNKGRFLAAMITPIPVVSTRYTVFLDGKRAPTRIGTTEPAFFYRTNNDFQPQLRLIRTKVKGNRREIEFLSRYFVEKKTTADEIPLNMQQVEPDTFRLLAEQDLAPGEYVLAELVPNQGIDLLVWDFGIDVSASKPAGKK